MRQRAETNTNVPYLIILSAFLEDSVHINNERKHCANIFM